MNLQFPAGIEAALRYADTSWQPILRRALAALVAFDADYLNQLEHDAYLPTEGRLFGAFVQPLANVRHVLVGEGPYPRAASATGVCFMDGAVGSLWSDQADGGLSKAVNRATSLRNLIKMLLLASGKIRADDLNSASVAAIAARARAPHSLITQTLAQLQDNLHQQGFLLLNASLVFRPHVAPKKEAKPWQVFFTHVLQGMLDFAQAQHSTPPQLVLWGKIAEDLRQLPVVQQFPQIIAEHPYNLSFITNAAMQAFFAPMDLLQLQHAAPENTP